MRIRNSIIRLILAILLLLCLVKMPYGYYALVRFVAFVGFGILAFIAYQKHNEIGKEALLYIALALLFQPFVKVALGRNLWNIVDVVVAIGLIGSLFLENKK